MRVVIDNLPVGNGVCRWCPKRARWSIQRERRYSWENLCHTHLGVALRNLGLAKLTVEKTATAAVEVEA